MAAGIHMDMKTDKETVSVHLGSQLQSQASARV